jgi:hypothetical protein
VEIPIEHPEFVGRKLFLQTASFFKGVKLILDGQEVEGKKSLFVIRGASGKDVELRVKGNHVDPIPNLEIDGVAVALAKPLEWYEYAWIGLPIILAYHGGALGAAIGYAALSWSARIFRSDRSVAAKYLMTGGITLGAAIAFLASAIILTLMIKGVPK